MHHARRQVIEQCTSEILQCRSKVLKRKPSNTSSVSCSLWHEAISSYAYCPSHDVCRMVVFQVRDRIISFLGCGSKRHFQTHNVTQAFRFFSRIESHPQLIGLDPPGSSPPCIQPILIVSSLYLDHRSDIPHPPQSAYRINSSLKPEMSPQPALFLPISRFPALQRSLRRQRQFQSKMPK